MKKFLVVLLTLGLIVAFGTTASAADVKFAGEYYVVGLYDNNYTLSNDGYSRAFFHQRFRLTPIFQVAEGLTFTARIDAMEKKWGNADWRRGVAAPGEDTTSSRPSLGVAGANTQQNIEWERAYVTFMTKAGRFQVGYQAADEWGTAFADNGTTRPRIMYTTAFGPLTLAAVYEKLFEADASGVAGYAGKTDADGDTYALFGIYKFKAGEAGLLYKYYNVAYGRVVADPNASKMTVSLLAPYTKLVFGPAYVEAEVDYFFGKQAKYEGAGAHPQDIDQETLLAYIHGRMNVGPAYFGGQIGYASGSDPGDATKNKQFSGGGTSWNPTLILASDDLVNWAGNLGGGPVGGITLSSAKTNMILYNLYGGFNPTPKVNIEAGLSYATAVKKPRVGAVDYISDTYGTEVDLKATYKIYDNLSYMVGAGYLWAGDYFKGVNTAAQVGNDYLLLNKLTLSF